MNSWPVRHFIAIGVVVSAATTGALALVFGLPGVIIGTLGVAFVGIFLSRRLAGHVDRLVNDLFAHGDREAATIARDLAGRRKPTDWRARPSGLKSVTRRFSNRRTVERRRVESILGSMQQGVIVVNSSGRGRIRQSRRDRNIRRGELLAAGHAARIHHEGVSS